MGFPFTNVVNVLCLLSMVGRLSECRSDGVLFRGREAEVPALLSASSSSFPVSSECASNEESPRYGASWGLFLEAGVDMELDSLYLI